MAEPTAVQTSGEPAADPGAPEPLIDSREAARLLGVAPYTLQQWIRDGGGPPHYRLGRQTLRFRRSELQDWLDDRSVSSDGIPAPERLLGQEPDRA